jgi:transcriptional regulator GlxA family with amidase domain
MIRFEEVLAENLSSPLQIPELCKLVAVSDRTLRLCCSEFLGMSPAQYVLLRRLEAARRALRDADPDLANVAEVARRFGFAELGRFTEIYRATFDEAPSTTLERIPRMRPAAP